jgi:anhydro-N-acetylmuramic acid kinase
MTATAFGRLDTAVGQFIATAVNALLDQSGLDRSAITAIGSHGQTIAHAPDGDEPASVQIGDANVIAERTGITTVSDFRRRDIAAGGQGAPLAPAFHNAVLRSRDETRVVLNLGGIANITVLPADPDAPVTGFDTGPANCLMDLWARQHLGKPCDEGGQWAASAAPDAQLLERLLDDPYFEQPPPKSTGTQYFSRQWLTGRLGAAKLAAEVVQATLLALTVRTISDAIEGHAADCGRLLVCGGGANNTALIAGLAGRLNRPVETTGDYGIDPQWMEAMAFAWLAGEALSGRRGNQPSVTGAASPRVLGVSHRV